MSLPSLSVTTEGRKQLLWSEIKPFTAHTPRQHCLMKSYLQRQTFKMSQFLLTCASSSCASNLALAVANSWPSSSERDRASSKSNLSFYHKRLCYIHLLLSCSILPYIVGRKQNEGKSVAPLETAVVQNFYLFQGPCVSWQFGTMQHALLVILMLLFSSDPSTPQEDSYLIWTLTWEGGVPYCLSHWYLLTSLKT